MKNILLAITSIVILAISLQSCKEDIELTGDFEETAVVYGLLDQADSIHMIKITRAFIGPGNALEIAQIPDSNYFNSVEGTVTEYVNGSMTNQWQLKDTMVDNKDTDGVFYAPQQKLYYFQSSLVTTQAGINFYLDNDARYVLDLNINNGEFTVTGETDLVSGGGSNLFSTNLYSSTQPFRFIDNSGDFISTNIAIGTGNAHIMRTSLNVEFTEWRGTQPTVVSFDWGIGEFDVIPSGSQVFSASGGTFYNLVRDHCTDDPTIDKRTFNSITATITGGSEVLIDYINVNAPSSALAQSKPTFTNLEASGDNRVIGIFTSRLTVTTKKYFIDPGGNSNVRCLNKNTTQFLCSGGVSPFSFCSDHPSDALEPWACN